MIGDLRERVELLKPQRVPDGGGGYAFNYTSLGTVSAQAQAGKSSRDRSMGLTQLRRRQRFLIRSRDDLVFEMRLVHEGRRYRITNIQQQDQRGQYTLIEGEETPA